MKGGEKIEVMTQEGIGMHISEDAEGKIMVAFFKPGVTGVARWIRIGRGFHTTITKEQFREMANAFLR